MVLDEVSLQVRAGELIVVEGHRASGKSSLARVAAALRRPDVGEVWIGERDIAPLQDASLPYVRRNIGYYSEELPLLPGVSALENVMLGAGARASSARRRGCPRRCRAPSAASWGSRALSRARRLCS